MKWMGGWSWEDYYSAPTDVTDEIIELINEEQVALEEKLGNL